MLVRQRQEPIAYDSVPLQSRGQPSRLFFPLKGIDVDFQAARFGRSEERREQTGVGWRSRRCHERPEMRNCLTPWTTGGDCSTAMGTEFW